MKTQFGEKRGMGRTMERKIGGKKVRADVVEEGLVGAGNGSSQRIFDKYFNVFSFLSLSLLLRKIQLPLRGSLRATTQGRLYEKM